MNNALEACRNLNKSSRFENADNSGFDGEH